VVPEVKLQSFFEFFLFKEKLLVVKFEEMLSLAKFLFHIFVHG
jgi:hypothetical protein